MNYYLDVLKDKDLTYSAKVLFIYLYEMYFSSKAVKRYGNYVEIDRQKALNDLNMCESTYEWCYKQLEKKYISVKNKPFVIKKEV
jgi:hypothetical protein